MGFHPSKARLRVNCSPSFCPPQGAHSTTVCKISPRCYTASVEGGHRLGAARNVSKGQRPVIPARARKICVPPIVFSNGSSAQAQLAEPEDALEMGKQHL